MWLKLSLSSSTSLPEWHLGSAVLVRSVQSHESHVVHRLRPLPPHRHGRRLAHDPQHDRRRDLLRHVCGARHHTHPVSGLFQEAVPRKGGSLFLYWLMFIYYSKSFKSAVERYKTLQVFFGKFGVISLSVYDLTDLTDFESVHEIRCLVSKLTFAATTWRCYHSQAQHQGRVTVWWRTKGGNVPSYTFAGPTHCPLWPVSLLNIMCLEILFNQQIKVIKLTGTNCLYICNWLSLRAYVVS